jgi:hypothetical protein
MCSKAPLLRGHYPASPLLRASPPPFRLQSISRLHRLYDLPCSADFPAGRRRFHQLPGMPLSPCCPYHPAEVACRLGQSAPCYVAFAPNQRARPSVSFFSRPPLGSLSLRPGDSLTIPRMALSVGFIRFVSSTNATQATGHLTITPVGLSPTEHASLRWSHWFAKNASVGIALCCNAFITMMQAAQLRNLDDPSHTRDLPSMRTLLVQPQMSPRRVVVSEI